MWQSLRSGIRGSEAKDIKGGTQVQIFYSSGGHKDVPRPEIELLVTLHEARDRMVCGAVLYLQEGQGRTLEASWKGLAATHSHVEMGRDHHGFYHEVT